VENRAGWAKKRSQKLAVSSTSVCKQETSVCCLQKVTNVMKYSNWQERCCRCQVTLGQTHFGANFWHNFNWWRRCFTIL